MLSLGPTIQLVNFENIIGSLGFGKFCSVAWSLKFIPIPKNFEVLLTQAPILELELRVGRSLMFNFFILSLYKYFC